MAGPTAYQRVTSATDYDTTGASFFLRFDGVDDFLVTGNIDFTATDKMTVVAGVRKLSDAARGILVELSSVFTNPGSFDIEAPDASLNNFSFVMNGTSLVAKTAAVAAPVTNVLTSIMQISASDSLEFRRNGVSGGAASGNSGTGTFGNYPLYIGRRGGTSLPFNGHLYQFVVRGAATTPADIQTGEKFVAGKTGVTLP